MVCQFYFGISFCVLFQLHDTYFAFAQPKLRSIRVHFVAMLGMPIAIAAANQIHLLDTVIVLEREECSNG